jgi:hypothetical protein
VVVEEVILLVALVVVSVMLMGTHQVRPAQRKRYNVYSAVQHSTVQHST